MTEGRFLNSDVPATEGQKFEALGHAGSDHYVGLETFENPGVVAVVYSSDEVVAHCPITGQPDFYTCEILLRGAPKLIESKSLKLWLRQFADPGGPGLFCEALAVFIRQQVMEAVGLEDEDHIQVTLVQKSRGGISIRSVA